MTGHEVRPPTLLSRRGFVGAAGAACLTGSLLPHRLVAGNPGRNGRTPGLRARPVPTRAQLEWQQDELALFLHFGVNTFTNREWGDGRERPEVFAPSRLDARQWARTARDAGFRAMILTAKHHDGFCLWPTATTGHSVRASPFRGGEGDVVREFVDACRTEGLKAGLYCSPWDRNSPAYGDSPRYNDLFCDQLTELLTRYGPINEVWFDGANGEGPNGKRQVYDWPRFWNHVKRLQPEAVIFSDAGPDVRWIGNERGVAGETNWSTVDPSVVPFPGAEGASVTKMLQEGDPAGTVWRPGETDVSIRPGWFYHPAEDARVRGADQLTELFFTSVGRNSKLLLNVPPAPDGLLHPADSASLVAMRQHLGTLFSRPLMASTDGLRITGPRQAEMTVDLGRTMELAITDVREDIAGGQLIARYRIDGSNGGAWQMLARGTTVGYRKLDRFPPVRVQRVRLTIEDALEEPRPVTLRLFG
jgi:alpha-L-fucosidase